MKKIVAYVLGAFGLLGVDLFTKYLAQVYLGDRVIPVIGEFVRLRYVVNYGVSFSLFSGNVFVTKVVPLVGTGVIVGCYIYLKKYFNKHKEFKCSEWINVILVLFLTCFVGNYLDRIFVGGVRDFISVPRFAIFNLADIYGTVAEVGAYAVLVYCVWKDHQIKKAKKEEEKLS